MDRPSLFIGSSSEGKSIAQHVRTQLKEEVEATMWHEGVFGLGLGTLESLVKAVEIYDFSVLVLTPDDMVESRAQVAQSPRDNVLFESGLFMGRIGRERTFIVYDLDRPIKLPSDLAGVTHAVYHGNRKDGNLLAALGEACDPIRETIKRLGAKAGNPLANLEIKSSRLVYLLRFLGEKKGWVRKGHAGRVLFSYKDPYLPIKSPYDEEGWKRAGSYALYYLCTLGLVEENGSEIRITPAGQEYLRLPRVQESYSAAFDMVVERWP